MFESRPLKVNWKGRELISGEAFRGLSNPAFPEAEQRWNERGKRVTYNTWGRKDDYFYRREATLSEGELELMAGAHVPAYPAAKGEANLGYSFEVPLAALGNASYEAITGRTSEPVVKRGQLSAQMPDGTLLDGASTRWICFSTSEGNLVFDFNPEGVTSYSDFAPSDLVGSWLVEKRGDRLRFSVTRRMGLAGNVVTGNVVIFEGKMDDYLARHMKREHLYSGPIPGAKRYVFADSRVAGSDVPALRAFGPEASQGWSSVENLTVRRSNPGSSYRQYATSEAPGTFTCAVKQPGLYIITVHAAMGDAAVGPFSITSNGEPIADSVSLSANSYTAITYTQWLNAGELKLRWQGHWAASAVTLQPVLHEKEDFVFNRDVWLEGDLPTPGDYRTARGQPAKYAVDIHTEPLTGKISDIAVPVKGAPKVALPPPNAMPWRYQGAIAAMGMDLHSIFREFDTEERVARRLDELKEQGIQIVMVEGLHGRHLYRESLENAKKNVALIVKEAHARGMKVIDHHDLPLLWNRGNGFRVLTEHIGQMQRSIDGDVPTLGLNFLDPDYKKEYFERTVAFIKETGLDGLMLDEAVFFGREFDFSPATREQFKRDTGLTIPIDERSPIIRNARSPLWKSWLEWRNQVVSDWFAELREAIGQVKPDFSLIRYITNQGFVSPAVFVDEGGDLFYSSNAIDFLGCEIMSRNIMYSYRSNYAYRKLFSGMRSIAEHPICGLVYSDDPIVQYFGWALLNMNAQTLWTYAELPKEQRKYLFWQDNMNLQTARPESDIAIVYSVETRNWATSAARSRHYEEALGLSQIMSDHQVQHEFIYTQALQSDRLKPFGLVILPNVACLSEADLAALAEYVKGGGNLLITGEFAISNEWGMPMESAIREEILGGARSETAGTSMEFSLPGKPSFTLSLADPIPVLSPEPGQENLVSGESRDEKSLCVATRRKLGRGSVAIMPVELGYPNFENEIEVGHPSAFVGSQPARELFHYILDILSPPADRKFMAGMVPKVLMSVFLDPSQDGDKYIHLLNASGVNLAAGEAFSESPPNPAFPPISQTLTFEIADSRQNIRAVAVRPEDDQPTELPVTKEASGRWKIQVPGKLVDPYCIIRLSQQAN